MNLYESGNGLNQSEFFGLFLAQISEWSGLVRIDSEWIFIRNFRQGGSCTNLLKYI